MHASRTGSSECCQQNGLDDVLADPAGCPANLYFASKKGIGLCVRRTWACERMHRGRISPSSLYGVSHARSLCPSLGPAQLADRNRRLNWNFVSGGGREVPARTTTGQAASQITGDAAGWSWSCNGKGSWPLAPQAKTSSTACHSPCIPALRPTLDAAWSRRGTPRRPRPRTAKRGSSRCWSHSWTRPSPIGPARRRRSPWGWS